ncbi:MAG: ATP-binding cassette domain-containing protein [Desulfobulbaceae bacterium]|nr:ATP-binding cassette domain-containing protein [Desulfobulbaceae bacterium]HIJ79833.1 ATP-binding cassette domain-containing protein [Deltaproteobacteria bacterium]
MSPRQPDKVLITADRLTPADNEQRPMAPLTVEIKAGTTTCFIGPDGSGKTRYLRALAGIDPAAGTLEIFQQTVAQLNENEWSAMRPQIGFAGAYTPLISFYNAWLNITLPAQYHQPANDHLIESKAHNLLDELEVKVDLGLLPAYLSRSQRQKLVLIRTLMLDPLVLFLDEPFKPFDPLDEENLAVFFNKLRKEKNLALVMATHNLPYAIENADCIFYVDADHLHRFSSGKELTDSPLADVQQFIHSHYKWATP